MAGGWTIAVHILFPIPFMLLTLLSIPLPDSIRQKVRHYILSFTDWVLFYKVGGTVTIYQILTSVSLFLFCLTAWETQQYADKVKSFVGSKNEVDNRALKWRSERNFWISFFSLTLWLLLYRMRALMLELNEERKAK